MGDLLRRRMTYSDNPLVASVTGKMREVTMFEMWALTQE